MKELLVLPTWILVRMVIPFLSSKHIWYKRKFTLMEWYSGSTDINKYFSVYFWVSSFCLIIASLFIKIFMIEKIYLII